MAEQMMGLPPDSGTPDPVGVDEGIGQVFGAPAPPAPGLYDDEKKMLQFYEDFRKECLEDRTVYEREWWRKLMYMLGRQWIYFDGKRGQWQDKRLTKWTPRPVTNYIAETVDTIRAVFGQVVLGVLARPGGQDPKNVAAAELADELEPCIVEEHDMKRKMRMQDFWLASLHNVFLHPWWDKHSDRNGLLVVPDEQCVICGAKANPQALLDTPECPECGGTQFMKAMDEDMMPVGKSTRVGRGTTDVVSPFELLAPPSVVFADVPGVIRQRWRSKRWWEDHHPELAKTLTFSGAPAEKSLQSLRALATQTDVGSSAGGFGGGESGEGLAENELWYKPCAKWPDGLFLRVAGESDVKIVHDKQEGSPGPLPNQIPDGSRLWPWIHIQFNSFGGRLWGRGPLDLIMQKQDQINQIDSLIQMIILRMANPIWLKPKGAEVQSFTGEPGLVVEWNPLAAGGTAKPERIPGENVPPSLMSIRKQLADDIEHLSGTYDILKGNKPAGVGAFSALQLLVERSQSRFGSALAERGDGYRQWYKIALELERLHGPEERVWSVLGPNRRWSLKHFQNADLQGAVEIIVEDGSQVPKTNLGKRASIEQADKLKVLKSDDPEQAYAIMKDFGLTHLIPSFDTHVKSALQEQDEFETWVAEEMKGPSPMAVKPWHEDAVHLSEHRKWANGDTVRQMLKDNPMIEDPLKSHLDAHEMSAVLKEMPPAQRAQVMSQQSGAGNVPGAIPGQQPSPGGAEGGAQALGSSNTNSAPLPTPQNAAPMPGGAM